MRSSVRRARQLAGTAVRAAAFLFTVRAAVPRWIAGLIVFGLLPIPGPVDEAAVVAAAALLWFRHRRLLRVCWHAALLEEAR